MVDVLTSFFLLGSIIIIGFIGSLIFEKTKVSDIILLMLIGLLIGPVFGVIGSDSILVLRDIAPFFAALALIVLMFEGGLQLNFYKVVREVGKATGFTLFVFALTVAFSSFILYALGWPYLTALMFGAIIGGVSSAVVLPLVGKTSASEETKTMLGLESAMTDALCVVITIAIIQLILSNVFDFGSVLQNVLGAFSIAAVIGFIAGLVWLKVLRDYSVKRYEYLLTIAVLFLVFVVVEAVKGNGAIAALVFGLVLGNSKEILGMLKLKPLEIDGSIKSFQKELGFFIKTFFFVYIGIIFELSTLSLAVIGIAVALMIGIFVSRYIGTRLLTRLKKEMKSDERLIFSMNARGLAASVLATYPIALGVPLQGFGENIVVLAFLVIFFSNISTTVGIFWSEKGKAQEIQVIKKKK